MSAYLNGKRVDIAYASNPNIDTLRDSVANAFKGRKVGNCAVRIDDASPIPHTMNFAVTPANLIDQEKFFASEGSWSIRGEVGKTYTISCVPQSWATDYGFIAELDENGMLLLTHSLANEVTLTIQEGYSYIWDFNGSLPIDLYESVSMVCEDVFDTVLKQYGKNLTKIEWNHTVSSRKATNINVPCDVTLSILKTAGTVLVYKSNDGFVTPINLKTFAASTTFCELEIEREEGYEYRVATTGTQYIEYIQTEVGNAATEYEEYKEPVVVSGASVLSAYPTATIVADTKGVDIEVEYNRDSNVVYTELVNAIRRLGGTV